MKQFYLKCLAVLALVTTISFTANAQCTGLTAPFTESFDMTTIPTCWTETATTGDGWRFTGSTNSVNCSAATDHTGNAGSYAWVDQSSSDAGTVLESDDIDVSALTTPYLEFFYWMCGVGYTPTNELYVEAWDGTIWNLVGSITTATSGWEAFGYDLSSFTYNGNFVKIRLRAESGGSSSDYLGDHAIDDISVMEAPSCFMPTGLAASNILDVSADISFTDPNTAASWEVEYGTAGFTPGTGTNMVSSANPISLSSLSPITSYDVYVRIICGVGDTSAWVSTSFTTSCPISGFLPPVLEDFSSGVPPTTCWDEANDGTPWNGGPTSFGSGSWTTDGFANQGSIGAAKINLYTTGKRDWLLSPDYELTSGGPYQVEYDFAIYNWSSSTTVGSLGSDDTVQVLISIDAGVTWTSLMVYDAAYTAVTNGDHVVIDLTAYSGNTVRFGIWGSEGTVNDPEDIDVSLDNFWVRAIPNCLDPSALGATNITTTSADLDWTAGGTETMWNIEYGLPGFTVNVDPVGVIATPTNPYTLTGLNPATTYEYYVQADCGVNNGTSLWIGPFSFTTLCVPYTAPFTENFDGLALTSPYTDLPNCWDPQAGPDYWDVTNDVTNTGHTYLPNIGDHTTGSGNYMWIDASSNITGNEMVTPMIDMSGLNAGYAGFWFASNNTTNNINHTINLDVWDGTAWVNMASMSGNFPDWVEVGGVVPAGIPTTTKFRIYATPDPNGTGSTYYFNDLGVDDFFVQEAPVNEVGVTAITVGNCSNAEAITIDITNRGVNTQTSIPVSFSINGAAPIMETWTGTLAAGATTQHTFAATFDASVAGNYNFNASTHLVGDENTGNDGMLSSTSVTPVNSAPAGETFEASTALPLGWTTNGSLTTAHNAGSRVVYRNMYNSGTSTFTTTTPKFAISAGDFMDFDYRYTDWSAGTVGTVLEGDSMRIQISTDCGATFTTVDVIDSMNHVVSAGYARLSYDMSAYAGQTVVARIYATWGGVGDYYLDLDNFFVGVPMTQSATSTDALCVGGNGTGTVAAVDGLAPYTYSWSNGATTATASGLSVGVNYYTVTDAAGAMIMDSVTIGEPAMAMSAMTSVDAMVSCNGAMDAAVSAMGMNGTAPYAYSWTNGATMDSLMSIGAGTYAVLVTDANGCIALATAVVTEPDAMSAMTMAADISCNGAADGTGDVMVSGGTGAYTYAWSNTATTPSLTGLGAGSYSVTATDANNCMVMDSVTIAEPMAIMASAATDGDVDCNGNANGGVTVTASGGTGMLSYAWSNGSALATLTNLTAGTYDVTVTDENGCMMTASADVTEPTALALAIATMPDSVALQLGEATATTTGGTSPYTYLWNDGQTTETATGLVEGLYTVTVTDANGCTVEGFVAVADVVSTNGIDYVSNLSIYPNPTNYNTTINLELSQNADIAVSIFTVTGVLVQDFGKENTSQINHQVDVSNYAEGMYLVRFVIDNQVVTKKLLVTK